MHATTTCPSAKCHRGVVRCPAKNWQIGAPSASPPTPNRVRPTDGAGVSTDGYPDTYDSEREVEVSGASEQRAERARLFDSLFTNHHQAVFRYCVRRLGVAEAEDAAADVFAIAWRRIDQVPPGDAQRAWLIGVAYKVVGNRFRSRRRRNRLSQRIESEQRARPERSPHLEPEVHMVRVALDRLSTTDQELIRLSSWDGLTRAEISAVLGVRVNTVDQRLHRARARLRTHFDQLVGANPTSTPEEAQL